MSKKHRSRGMVTPTDRRSETGDPRRPDHEVLAEAQVVDAGICPLCGFALVPRGPTRTPHGDARDPADGEWLRCSRPGCSHVTLPGTKVCKRCSRPMAPLALGKICVRCRQEVYDRDRTRVPLTVRRRCRGCRRPGHQFNDLGICPECSTKAAAAANPKGVDDDSQTQE